MTASTEDEAPAPPSARERWLAERRMAVTATDAGAILGVSKYADPLSVYLEKIGEPLVVEQTSRMEAGNRLQRPIIDWWGERTGRFIEHYPAYSFTRRPGSILGASLDAVTYEPTMEGPRLPADGKNIGWRTAEWGEDGSDRAPLTYLVQLAVQMHVLGAPRAFLPVLFGGHELVCYEIERDPELEAAIVERCEHFWMEHVEPRVPPPVDGSAAWGEYLTRTFAKHSDVVLRATAEQGDFARQLAATIEQLKLAEGEVDRLKNLMKLAIGEAYALEGPNFRATWSKSSDTIGVDWESVAKAIALEHAQMSGQPATKLVSQLAQQHKHVTRKGSRSFRFTFRGE